MKKTLSIIITIATLIAIYFLFIKPLYKSEQGTIPVWDSTLINHSKIPDSL